MSRDRETRDDAGVTGGKTDMRGARKRPDPIFGAIRRHARAEAALDAAAKAGQPKPVRDRAVSAAYGTGWALVETLPTTILGIVTLLEHVAEHDGAAGELSERIDYDQARKWRFMPVLLRNVAVALAKIEAAPAIMTGGRQLPSACSGESLPPT